MVKLDDLLSKVESQRLWSYFHKDWLLQIRTALRDQLPDQYRVFVESEAVLISPESVDLAAAPVLPDVAIARNWKDASAQSKPGHSAAATTAIIEVDEPCELETHYSLLIRRAPDNLMVAAIELLSPFNKGVGNTFDREKHLRKRQQYLESGVNLLEVDALTKGTRDLPAALAALMKYDRVAWIARYDAGRRQFRGWGWSQSDPQPVIDWLIDDRQIALVDLARTLADAISFNRWETLANG